MALKRLLGLGSKRLRALAVLGAAAKAIRAGRLLRGVGLIVLAALAWKYFLVAMVAEALVGALRRHDAVADDPSRIEAET